jgi:hypothetical protein
MAATGKVFNIKCSACRKPWRVNRTTALGAQYPEGVAMGGSKDPALAVADNHVRCTCGALNLLPPKPVAK